MLPDRLGSPNNRGGAMVTGSGLVFIAGGDGISMCSSEDGQGSLADEIPYTNTANPMTYRTRSGRQFIVIATGTSADNSLVAFALGGS